MIRLISAIFMMLFNDYIAVIVGYANADGLIYFCFRSTDIESICHVSRFSHNGRFNKNGQDYFATKS